MLELRKSFAGYELLELVGGQSDYREVYLARGQDGTKVFLTVYKDQNCEMLMDEGRVREFELVRHLQSDAFPKYLGGGSDRMNGSKMSYMVTRYFEAVSLREMVKREPLPEEQSVAIAKQLLLALAELCDVTRGGGHYNICPDTVWVSKVNGNPMVHVVGLDHAAEPCCGRLPFKVASLNPCCRAPETFYGHFSSSADVYSVGMLLGFMAQGRYPYFFDETFAPELIQHVIKDKKSPHFQMSEGLKEIALKAVNKNAKKRYGDVCEFYEALSFPISKTGSEEPDFCFFDEDDELPITPMTKKGKGLAAVAGMNELKDYLRNDFVDVVAHRDLAAKFGLTPSNIILYGPQGCGKTYISQCLAEECGMQVYMVKPSDLGSIYVHGTQSLIKGLFEKAKSEARKNRNGCLLLIDEIDSHLGSRSRNGGAHQDDEVAEWLVQLNECVDKHVYVIGMTNRIDALDKAAIRTGRFDRLVYVPLPDLDCRKQFFGLRLADIPHDPTIDLETLALMTEGYATSDLVFMVKEAARRTFMACVKSHNYETLVSEDLLKQVIASTRPSVSRDEVLAFERMRDSFSGSSFNNRQRIGYLA